MDNFAYLVCVNPDQNCNKFYKMKQISPDEWVATYGREGKGEQQKIFPMSRWNQQYKSKLRVRNGYKYTDVTNLFAEEEVFKTKNFKSKDKEVIDFLQTLLDISGKSVRKNYKFSSERVTISQVEEVEKLLTLFSDNLNQSTISYLNSLLVEIFTVLPRKMEKVKDFIIPENSDKDTIVEILKREEETLEAMRSMVVTKQDNKQKELFVEDSLGIDSIYSVEDDYLGQSSTFVVKCSYFEDRFNRYLKEQENKTTKLLFHGSRPENWLSIIERSLMIKPSGVHTSGSIFGNGIYFSDSLHKSLNYCRQSPKIIGVYEVHIGDQYVDNYGNSSLNLKNIHPKHSVLGNRIEYIVYRPEQCVLKRLFVFS